MLEIRKANIADAQALALLGRVTYIQSHEIYFENKEDIIEYCNTEYSVSNIEKGIKDSNNVFLLATMNQLPVGYAKVILNAPSDLLASSKVCLLQKIYVLDDFISMKIGHELHNAVLAEARKQGIEDIWLTVYYKNTRAIKFYLKNGFKKVGDYDFKVGEVDYKNEVLARKL